jgi:NADPH:quinone reductase-like Zn-dependent oxidoreductase
MRRIVIRRPGGYERLLVEEAPDPVAGPGEVVVAVEAAGVNYADCIVRMGLYRSAKDFMGWPATPGFEVAGTSEGRRVLAVTRFGGYATRVAVPEDQVFPLPERMDVAEAAGFPVVFLTAYYALFELARPRRGSRVLVPSAAGGVGGALLQLAKVAGCDVTAVVGAPHKVEVARAADAVFDSYGGPGLRQAYARLAPMGRLVVYGFASMMRRGRGRPDWPRLLWTWLRTPRFDPLRMTNDNKGVLAFNLSYLFDRKELLAEAMARLLGLLREGAIRPPPVTRYPFAEVARAHRDLESGTTVGKLVLVP